MEKDNVRTKSEVHTAVDVFSRWISHGQMVRAMVERLPDSSIVIVDEPDMALDSEGIFTLRSVLMELGASGRQAIVSVHNPILWIGTRIVLGEDSSYPEKVVSAYRDSLK
jgi:predicted ATPase